MKGRRGKEEGERVGIKAGKKQKQTEKREFQSGGPRPGPTHEPDSAPGPDIHCQK